MGAGQSSEAEPAQNHQQSDSFDGRANEAAAQRAEGLLAWPGRDRIDPRARYFIGKHSRQGPHYDAEGREVQFSQSTAQNMPDMGLYERTRDDQRQTFERQAWLVGVAANPWRVVNESGSSTGLSGERLGHWGVYIRRSELDDQVDVDRDPIFNIFGMNFQKEYKDQLILEDVWGTPGDDGQGVWKRNIRQSEFHRIEEDGLLETEMYFSYEELVFTLQALLRAFANDSQRDTGVVRSNSGNSYSLFFANCQHFSRTAIDELKSRNWTDPTRLQTPFSVRDFYRTIEDQLIAERGAYENRQPDQGVLQAALKRGYRGRGF